MFDSTWLFSQSCFTFSIFLFSFYNIIFSLLLLGMGLLRMILSCYYNFLMLSITFLSSRQKRLINCTKNVTLFLLKNHAKGSEQVIQQKGFCRMTLRKPSSNLLQILSSFLTNNSKSYFTKKWKKSRHVGNIIMWRHWKILLYLKKKNLTENNNSNNNWKNSKLSKSVTENMSVSLNWR